MGDGLSRPTMYVALFSFKEADIASPNLCDDQREDTDQ